MEEEEENLNYLWHLDELLHKVTTNVEDYCRLYSLPMLTTRSQRLKFYSLVRDVTVADHVEEIMADESF